ncbi:unnamed protein product [Urochloa humidicola]
MGEQQEGTDAASAVGELCRGGIEQAAISKPSSLLLTEQQAAISRHAKFQWKKNRAWSFTSSSGSPRGPTTVAQATDGELHAPHASARTGTDRARRSPGTHTARPLGLRGPPSPAGGGLPPLAADSDRTPIPGRPWVEERWDLGQAAADEAPYPDRRGRGRADHGTGDGEMQSMAASCSSSSSGAWAATRRSLSPERPAGAGRRRSKGTAGAEQALPCPLDSIPFDGDAHLAAEAKGGVPSRWLSRGGVGRPPRRCRAGIGGPRGQHRVVPARVALVVSPACSSSSPTAPSSSSPSLGSRGGGA